MKTLSSLLIGEKARVTEVRTQGGMRRRFLDIGLIKGTVIECVGVGAAGDPKAFLIRGAVIAIRNDDSSFVLVE